VTLRHLGEAQAETGDEADARASLTQALMIFEQIGSQGEAAETDALLSALLPGHDRR